MCSGAEAGTITGSVKYFSVQLKGDIYLLLFISCHIIMLYLCTLCDHFSQFSLNSLSLSLSPSLPHLTSPPSFSPSALCQSPPVQTHYPRQAAVVTTHPSPLTQVTHFPINSHTLSQSLFHYIIFHYSELQLSSQNSMWHGNSVSRAGTYLCKFLCMSVYAYHCESI